MLMIDLVDYVTAKGTPAPAAAVDTTSRPVEPQSWSLTGYDAAQPVEPQPVQAAVKPWVTFDMRERKLHQPSASEEMSELAEFYRTGNPGVFGAAVDIVANTSTMLIPVPQKMTPTGWQTEPSDELFQILNFFRGPNASPPEMWARLYALFDVVAEVAVGMVQHQGRWVYVMAPRHMVSEEDNKVVFRGSATGFKSATWEVDPERVWIVYAEDIFDPSVAYTRMLRGLESLRMYRQATHTIGRVMDSQLAMNGILWAKAIPGAPIQGQAASKRPKWMTSIAEWSKIASQPRPLNRKVVADFVPFMLQTGEKPEHIETGKTNLADYRETADWAVSRFAADIDFPNTWLTNGPGTEKYANAFFQSDWFASMTMAPRSRRVWDAITVIVLRTWLDAAHQIGVLRNYETDQWRFWVDDRPIRPSDDRNLYQKIALARVGGYDMDHLALEMSEGDENAVVDSESRRAVLPLSGVNNGDSDDGGEAEPGSSEPVAAALTYSDELVVW